MTDLSAEDIAIVWLRNDLRLSDNPALAHAVSRHDKVAPVFVHDEAGRFARGGAAKWWLDGSLKRLGEAMTRSGGGLILRSGDSASEVLRLVAETGARAVYWNRRYDPDGIETDAGLKAKLLAAGVDVESFSASLLCEPWELKSGSGGPYQVFTPFWKAMRSRGPSRKLVAAPRTIRLPTNRPVSDDLDSWRLAPSSPDWAGGLRATWTPGETVAQQRVLDFIDGALSGYESDRNRPDVEGTSRLSPHLAFGEIGPLQVWARVVEAVEARRADEDAATKFLSEIAWRDFSYNLLFAHPEIVDAPLRREFSGFPWRDDPAAFERWTMGKTGIPIVDAGMRQLWATGWMHNRVRMIVASFLSKNLLLDWRLGERWFWDTLVDADPASNPASWQWVAGSGADAAPYFRIFNPVTQSRKFDPDGNYIRSYIPELARLDSKAIHDPSSASPIELEAAGVRLGETYPRAIVDLAETRKRALAAYQETRAA